MKKILLTIYLIIGITYIGNAQFVKRDSIKFSGIVYNKYTLDSLPGTSISFRGKLFTTNQHGQFAFYAFKNDRINFSHVGFKNFTLTIPDTLSGKDFIVAIALSSDTVLLSEVVIRPRINYEKFKEMVLYGFKEERTQANHLKNNIEYTKIAANKIPKKLDAEMLTDMKMRSYEEKAINMGLIPQDQMIGLNFIAVVPWAIMKLSGKLDKTGPELFLLDEETYLLKQILYREYNLKQDSLKNK